LAIISASDGTFSYTSSELLGGAFTNASHIDITYQASDALSGLYQVRLDGVAATAGTGTLSVILPPGISTHRLEAEDVAGNITTLSFQVVSVPPGTFSGGVAPQGSGFWKEAVNNSFYNNAQMAMFLSEINVASHAFGSPLNRYPDATLDNYEAILTFQPADSMDQQVERALLTSWLNFVSGREPAAAVIDVSKLKGWQTVITDTNGSSATTALNLVREVERRLDGAPSATLLETIKNLMEDLNQGMFNL